MISGIPFVLGFRIGIWDPYVYVALWGPIDALRSSATAGMKTVPIGAALGLGEAGFLGFPASPWGSKLESVKVGNFFPAALIIYR